MLSISFLPWVTLLLVVIFSIPVAATIENRRRKKFLEEAAADQPVIEGEEAGEMMVAEEGVEDFGEFGTQADPFGNVADDPFK